MAGKGGRIEGAGRKKGVPNKDNRRFKVALFDMFENKADKIEGWLDEVAADDPNKALDHLNKWAEYIFPKLQRTEQQQLDKDGNKADAGIAITIKHIKSDGS
jgi:hypothetical protein